MYVALPVFELTTPPLQPLRPLINWPGYADQLCSHLQLQLSQSIDCQNWAIPYYSNKLILFACYGVYVASNHIFFGHDNNHTTFITVHAISIEILLNPYKPSILFVGHDPGSTLFAHKIIH